MAQEVAKIVVFPEEQIQKYGVNAGTLPMFGLARLGDKKPTGFRKNITPANVPNRIPRIPCQFVAVAFDNGGNKINGGDVKDGILYGGAVLPNGNTVELKWSTMMQNGKWAGGFGDARQPQAYFSESVNAGDPPGPALGFTIDDTGLLIPGNDGVLKFRVAGPSIAEPDALKSGDYGFNNDFDTDRSCDGFITVNYAEMKPDSSKTNALQAKIKGVVTQPDWAVEAYDTASKGWHLS